LPITQQGILEGGAGKMAVSCILGTNNLVQILIVTVDVVRRAVEIISHCI
jgi:hypothetical protein